MTVTSTTDDVIKAAASIARDAAEGRLDPTQLDAQLEAACRDLVGTVAGPDDPLWSLQLDIARQVVARGGIPTDELAEWLAVQRRRENPEPVEAAAGAVPAEGAVVLADADSSALEPYSAENDAVPADAAPEPDDVAEPEPEPATNAGCGCAAHTAQRGPKFNGTILARGRGLPGQ